MRKLESGSAHIIIVVIIVLGIISGLAYLFYANIINKNNSNISPAAVTKTFDSTESTVEYCTKYEKICFNYPKGWKVTQEQTETENGDALSIINTDGTVSLFFESGISAFDVCCGPMPEGEVSVVGVQKATKFSKDMYVSEVVTPSVEGEYPDPSEPVVKSVVKGYIPQIVLHQSSELAKISTFTRTLGTIVMDSTISGQHATVNGDETNHGSFIFGTVIFNIKSNPKVFATFNDAKKQFDTESYKQAKEILLSAKYK